MNQKTDNTSVRASSLRVDDISISFRRLQALANVSLEVPAQAAVGIVGPNGAGKTTLVNCISGIYRPSRGRIELGGERIDGQAPYKIVAKGVVRTFQTVEHLSSITVLDLVLAGRHQRFRTGSVRLAFGTPACRREELHQRSVALTYLDRFGLGSLASRPVTKVPYGSRKLVDLARALATEPKLLVLDEPAAGVSAVEKSELVEILSQSRGELFGSLILIEHDLEFVRRTCESLVVLDFGHKIAEGSVDEVLRSSSVREAYLGL